MLSINKKRFLLQLICAALLAHESFAAALQPYNQHLLGRSTQFLLVDLPDCEQAADNNYSTCVYMVQNGGEGQVADCIDQRNEAYKNCKLSFATPNGSPHLGYCEQAADQNYRTCVAMVQSGGEGQIADCMGQRESALAQCGQ
jgi:hypothetical protein